MSSAQVLFKLLGLTDKIRCLDLGALSIGDELDPWVRLAFEEGLAEVIGFEPVEEECARLNSVYESHQGAIRYLPFAIGDGAKHSLRVTNVPMTSSLFEPLQETIEVFSNLGELMRVEKRISLTTKRLDDLAGLTGAVDFIKLDIQGAELMALENAKNLLGAVGVVQCEVEFVELYQDQPLFADIDRFLRSQGFCFLKFAYLMGRPYKPLTFNGNPNVAISQTLWGDAVYVKDFRNRQELDASILRRTAFLLHELYGAYDLAHLFVEELDRRHGTALASSYRSLVLGSNDQPTKPLLLSLPGDISILVPDSLEQITPYVLLEQQDWFEDEIKFVRSLLRPGQVSVDIGASFGVYTLTMAHAVGDQGKVFAFEPATKTADFLRRSLHANNFGQVDLIQLAISDAPGKGQLSSHQHSELNALLDHSMDLAAEAVTLESLDCFFHGRTDVDFLKIDAEGQEHKILNGGGDFLDKNSPLVLYEVKDSEGLHLDLVESFTSHGYDSYRLLPGLNLLVPFESSFPSDGFLLNLFACKRDRASQLRRGGQLVLPEEWPDHHPLPSLEEAWSCVEDCLESFPYATQRLAIWRERPQEPELISAIALFHTSHHQDESPPRRASALRQSFDLFKALAERSPTASRLSSLARVAQDYGARSVAVDALQSLIDYLILIAEVDVDEPFLLPSQRFDAIPPRDSLVNWLGAAALEERERLGAYSSFYSGEASRERLEMIATLGFASEEMNRRLSLLNRRRDACEGVAIV